MRAAMFMPRIWVSMRLAMAMPAASSLEVLTRRPEDRRCMEVESDDWLPSRLRCVVSDSTLVLMDMAMIGLLDSA